MCWNINALPDGFRVLFTFYIIQFTMHHAEVDVLALTLSNSTWKRDLFLFCTWRNCKYKLSKRWQALFTANQPFKRRNVEINLVPIMALIRIVLIYSRSVSLHIFFLQKGYLCEKTTDENYRCQLTNQQHIYCDK